MQRDITDCARILIAVNHLLTPLQSATLLDEEKSSAISSVTTENRRGVLLTQDTISPKSCWKAYQADAASFISVVPVVLNKEAKAVHEISRMMT